jgi:alpha-tubulin suppressor-like RCC1 family protein
MIKRKNNILCGMVLLLTFSVAVPSAFSQEEGEEEVTNPCNIYAAGGNHTAIFKEIDGSIWLWGDNRYGQLGDGTTISRNRPIPLKMTGWKAVALGADFTIAVHNDGTLWAWGRNNYGQLGVGDFDDRHVPTQVGTDNDWEDVVSGSGSHHAFAIKTFFTLWGWGRNANGQVGDETTDNVNEPVEIIHPLGGLWGNYDYPSLNLIKSTGANHTLMLDISGYLWAWGGNEKGQLGVGEGDTMDRYIPTAVIADPLVEESQLACLTASAGDGSSLATGHPDLYYNESAEISYGSSPLLGWGDNSNGQLGLGPGFAPQYELPVVIDKNNWDAAQTQNGYSTVLPNVTSFSSDPNPYYPGLFMWGLNNAGQLGLGFAGEPKDYMFPQIDNNSWGAPDQLFFSTMGARRSPALGQKHVIGAMKSTADTLYVWGDNTYGQLGLGDNEPRYEPTPLEFPAGYIVAEGMLLGDTTTTMHVGDMLMLTTYGNHIGDYTSENPKVATVDPTTGKVTAVGLGTTRIHRPLGTCAAGVTDEDVKLIITIVLPPILYIPVNPHLKINVVDAGAVSHRSYPPRNTSPLPLSTGEGISPSSPSPVPPFSPPIASLHWGLQHIQSIRIARNPPPLPYPSPQERG